MAEEETPVSPIAHGVLADNKLAKIFEAPDKTSLPGLPIDSLNGERALYDIIRGRTILMPLWAEWCQPCLAELPDFARLQQKYGGASFAIVPILTGAHKQVTPQVLVEIFAGLHASAFEPLVEHKFGKQLMMAMAHQSFHEVALPCNLLIGPSGTVVAREIGIQSSAEQAAATKQARETEHKDMLQQAEAGAVQSLWGTEAGDQFAAAMANGFLDGY